MTTLAAPRSLKTSVTSVYHAQVDDALYHCRLGRKIQGHFIQLNVNTKSEEPISGLKLPFYWQSMTGEDVVMPIASYDIEWQERLLSPTKAVDQSRLFHGIDRLFRIVFGR
jgi:hypothetical protein